MAGAGLGGDDQLAEVGDEGWGESGAAGDVEGTGVEAAGGVKGFKMEGEIAPGT